VKQKRYDEEFKRDAVRMMMMGERPLKVLAQELGVSDASLRGWRNRYLEEEGRHPRGEGMPTPRELADENRRLRRELDRVVRQRDILKKAMGICSETSPGGMP
jgi:transposase